MYKVLIVDDEIMICRGLSKIIKWKDIGFEVVGAVYNGQEALKVLAKGEVDVLLTDISMPEITGLELIRRAKELCPDVKTVVISGYSEFDYAFEAIKLKVENYILKPLDPQKITKIFEHIYQDLERERQNQKIDFYLHSEYEMLRSGNSEHKGCHQERQTELIQLMEEGRYQEAEQAAEEWFLFLKEEEMVEYCLKTLRNAVLYFHLEKPPYFHIYRVGGQEARDRERVKEYFKEDLQVLANCLKETAGSTVVMVSQQARHLIEEHYADKNFTLKEAAARLGVSYGYLSAAFSKTYGENFKTCLASVRAEKARALLLERKYRIYEIADMTGYGSPRYFTDAFKRRYGISPVDYLGRLNQRTAEDGEEQV